MRLLTKLNDGDDVITSINQNVHSSDSSQASIIFLFFPIYHSFILSPSSDLVCLYNIDTNMMSAVEYNCQYLLVPSVLVLPVKTLFDNSACLLFSSERAASNASSIFAWYGDCFFGLPSGVDTGVLSAFGFDEDFHVKMPS